MGQRGPQPTPTAILALRAHNASIMEAMHAAWQDPSVRRRVYQHTATPWAQKRFDN